MLQATPAFSKQYASGDTSMQERDRKLESACTDGMKPLQHTTFNVQRLKAASTRHPEHVMKGRYWLRANLCPASMHHARRGRGGTTVEGLHSVTE
jgi:hypothetical protein